MPIRHNFFNSINLIQFHNFVFIFEQELELRKELKGIIKIGKLENEIDPREDVIIFSI